MRHGRTLLAAQWAGRQHERGRLVVWVAGAGRRGRPPLTWAAVRAALVAALRAAGTAVPDDVTAVTRLVTAAHGLRTLLVTGTRHPHSPPAARHPDVTALDDRLDVTTFTTRDLMLTADELRAAAASWGHPVDDRMLACVVELVGGWPALARTVLDDTGPDDEEPDDHTTPSSLRVSRPEAGATTGSAGSGRGRRCAGRGGWFRQVRGRCMRTTRKPGRSVCATCSNPHER